MYILNCTLPKINQTNMFLSVDYSISPRKPEDSSLTTSKSKGNL